MSQKVKKAHIKREHSLAEGSSCREGLWFCKAWGEAADKVVASELAGTHRDWKRPICREGWEGIRRCAKTQATIYELVKAGTSTQRFLELTRVISYSLADPSRPKVTESWARRKSCQCLVFCTGLLINDWKDVIVFPASVAAYGKILGHIRQRSECMVAQIVGSLRFIMSPALILPCLSESAS